MKELNRLKKPFLLLIGCTLFVPHLFAQEMSMSMPSQQQEAPETKNVFLHMMDTMMVKMEQIPVGKSADFVFTAEMIPHHQGAIAMANYEIANGKDFTMIQLAKSILAEQTTESQQMNLWIVDPSFNTGTLPKEFQQEMDQTMEIMMKELPPDNTLKHTDQSFAAVMIPHHQAAINMAKVILKYTTDQRTASFAKQLLSLEQMEIEQMSTFIK